MAGEPAAKGPGPMATWVSNNLNIPTLITLGAAIFAIITSYNRVQNDLEEIKRDRTERSTMADKRFTSIESILQSLNSQNIPYRLTLTEGEQRATNHRLDEFARTVSQSMAAQRELTVSQNDLMRKDINALGTDLRVLATKIDGVLGPPRRPVWTPPEPERYDPPSQDASIPYVKPVR